MAKLLRLKTGFFDFPTPAPTPRSHYIDSNCGIRKTKVNRVLTALTITTVLFSSVFEMVHARADKHALLARACRKQMYRNVR